MRDGGFDGVALGRQTRRLQAVGANMCIRRREERRQAVAVADGKERSMNLVVWLPAMFALGLVSFGVCLAFALACEHI
jgi:hypothetical protein